MDVSDKQMHRQLHINYTKIVLHVNSKKKNKKLSISTMKPKLYFLTAL